MVKNGHVVRAGADLLGVSQARHLREVNADEEIRRHVVVHRVHEGVGTRKEAVDPGHGVLVGQEVGHALARPRGANDLGQGKAGANGVAIGRGVRADRDGVGILDQRDNALEELRLLHVFGNPHQALPYSPSSPSTASLAPSSASAAMG